MTETTTTGLPLESNPAPPKKKIILWKWSLLVAVLLFGYLAWQCGSALSAGARLSDDAVRHFHSQLDAQAYEEIFSGSDKAFQTAGSQEDTIKFLAGVHNKLGASQDFRRANLAVNATPNGAFIRADYNTTFEQGKAVETFNWKKESGGLKLVGYDIHSSVFITR